LRCQIGCHAWAALLALPLRQAMREEILLPDDPARQRGPSGPRIGSGCAEVVAREEAG